MVYNPTLDPGLPVMSFYEVNVTLRIKMKGLENPIVLSRCYLPEYKVYDSAEFASIVKSEKPYASKMAGHTDLYDYQMKRIYDIFDIYGIDYTR